ncbi:MAG: hypothetical protein M5U34_46965 [Chloroflexi bacterium]|nr:hypothetical protein [Chloroflexota bacterium]
MNEPNKPDAAHDPANWASRFDCTHKEVTQVNVCVDKRVQWSEAKNVWHNAMIRTAVYMPVHLTKRLFNKG